MDNLDLECQLKYTENSKTMVETIKKSVVFFDNSDHLRAECYHEFFEWETAEPDTRIRMKRARVLLFNPKENKWTCIPSDFPDELLMQEVNNIVENTPLLYWRWKKNIKNQWLLSLLSLPSSYKAWILIIITTFLLMMFQALR